MVEAPSEAEATCARLCKAGKVPLDYLLVDSKLRTAPGCFNLRHCGCFNLRQCGCFNLSPWTTLAMQSLPRSQSMLLSGVFCLTHPCLVACREWP